MKRNEKIDIIKGIAIFFVVYGHSIQYGSGQKVLENGEFFLDSLFKIIYSFHMPLFMLITGYLFQFTLSKYNTWQIIKSRISTLVVPICVWSLIPFSVKLDANTGMGIIKLYISTAIRELWFLWAVFYCSLVVLLVNRYLKDNIIIYLIVFFITFFVPDKRNFELYMYMYSFFVLGYFYGKYAEKINIRLKKIKNRNVILPLTLGVYVLLLAFFDYDSYIYISGYSVLGKDTLRQVGIDMFRFLIGLVGSLLVIMLVDNTYSLIKDRKLAEIMTYIGRNSMGIYVVSGVVFSYVLPKITKYIPNINYIVVLIESIVIIFFSLIINKGLKKNKILSGIFLGGRI